MGNTHKMMVEKLKDLSSLITDHGTEEYKQALDEMIATLHGIVEDDKKEERKDAYMFTEEKKLDVFAECDSLKLCCFKPEDKDDYLRLAKEVTIMPKAFEKDGFADDLWEGMFEEQAFYTVIRRDEDNAFVGYCGIKNLKKDRWELAIELLKEFRNQGYGKNALYLYMDKVKEITGVDFFIAMVDGENVASQKMCEALGGKPDGIAEHLLHDKAYMTKYEQEHVEDVTDVMREAARKFNVEPEKLLTHVLVYKFEV